MNFKTPPAFPSVLSHVSVYVILRIMDDDISKTLFSSVIHDHVN